MKISESFTNRYNPANIQPEWFLNSPTSLATEKEVIYLAKQVADALENEKPPFYPSRVPGRKLLMGTELEVLFFSPDADPRSARNSKNNPNYKPKHEKKIDRIAKAAEKLTEKYKDIGWCDAFGRLGIEYRTEPCSLEGHIEATERIKDHVTKISKKFDVLPVVLSQHIHTSLMGKTSNVIQTMEKYTGPQFRTSLHHAFQDVGPLVQSPEEYDYNQIPLWRWALYDQPVRIEFRLLSSEYACDPALNTLICLRSLYQGVSLKWTRPVAHDSISTYERATNFMENDPEVVSFFGQSLISQLSQIASYYPAVSRREITVPQLVSELNIG